MSRFAHLPYRQGVGLMIFNAQGKVFVGKRIDMISEAWQMPQGGVDEGESPRDAVKRELDEETGIVSFTILDETDVPLPYDLPDELVPKIWKGRYRGQLQHWFALRFTGEESEIDLTKHTPELSEYRWIEIDELPEMIVPFKRELYTKLVERFRPWAVPA